MPWVWLPVTLLGGIQLIRSIKQSSNRNYIVWRFLGCQKVGITFGRHTEGYLQKLKILSSIHYLAKLGNITHSIDEVELRTNDGNKVYQIPTDHFTCKDLNGFTISIKVRFDINHVPIGCEFWTQCWFGSSIEKIVSLQNMILAIRRSEPLYPNRNVEKLTDIIREESSREYDQQFITSLQAINR